MGGRMRSWFAYPERCQSVPHGQELEENGGGGGRGDRVTRERVLHLYGLDPHSNRCS